MHYTKQIFKLANKFASNLENEFEDYYLWRNNHELSDIASSTFYRYLWRNEKLKNTNTVGKTISQVLETLSNEELDKLKKELTSNLESLLKIDSDSESGEQNDFREIYSDIISLEEEIKQINSELEKREI